MYYEYNDDVREDETQEEASNRRYFEMLQDNKFAIGGARWVISTYQTTAKMTYSRFIFEVS